jgi:hypothetical protein
LSPPHVPHPPGAVAPQLPVSVPPHIAPGATHLPPAQQPAPAHVLLPQQARPSAPHAWNDPDTHTVAASEPDSPGATHRFVTGSRHAPLAQVVAPGHATVPATPQ